MAEVILLEIETETESTFCCDRILSRVSRVFRAIWGRVLSMEHSRMQIAAIGSHNDMDLSQSMRDWRYHSRECAIDEAWAPYIPQFRMDLIINFRRNFANDKVWNYGC